MSSYNNDLESFLMKRGVLMKEQAERIKLYALFRQLSDAHKREILKKTEDLVSAGIRESSREDRERQVTDKQR
jgi:hypothetical protein